MDKRKKIVVITGLTAAVALGGGGLAYGSGAVGGDGEGDGNKTPVTGPDADRAGQAAVASVGGGTVVHVYAEQEGDVAYEVEVKKPDGTSADVEIAKDFSVVPAEQGEAADGNNGGNNGGKDDGKDGGAGPEGVGK